MLKLYSILKFKSYKKKLLLKKKNKTIIWPFVLLCPAFEIGLVLRLNNRTLTRLRFNKLTYKLRFYAFFAALHKNGKKNKAELLMISIILILRSHLKCRHPFLLIYIIFKLLEPFFFLRRFKRFGQVFFIPVPAVKRKRSFLAMKFFFSSIKIQRKASFKTLSELISNEIILLFSVQLRENALSLQLKRDFIKEVFAHRFSCRFLRVNVGKVIL